MNEHRTTVAAEATGAFEEARMAVLGHLDAHRDRIVDLVQELVSIPTVNPKFQRDPSLNREADAQDVVAGRLRSAGMQVETFDLAPGRPNVVGLRQGVGGGPTLAINGHIDVVPAGDLSLWSHDPYQPQVREGRMYGRGTFDMKAGLAAAVAAAEAIEASGVDLAGSLAVHSVVDEEAGGAGTRQVVGRGHQASGVIVAEPSQGRIITCQGGLEWVRVTLRGAQAHTGCRYNDIYPQPNTPDRVRPGVNAIELLKRFLDAVQHLERSWGLTKHYPLLPPGITTISPSVVQGGYGIGAEGLPATMTNPATTPDVVTVDFDLKYLPNENSAQIRAEFEQFVHHWSMLDPWTAAHPPTITWDLHGLHFPEFETDPDAPLVQAIRRQCDALGRSSAVTGNIGVCDGAFYVESGGTPVVFGPLGGDAHGADEWVDTNSILDVAKVMAVAALEYCGVVVSQ